jgi:tetratricopeptide (TPR) repeat protein
MARQLDLDEDQVEQLAAILDDLKTQRAQAEVDRRKAVSVFADAFLGDDFDGARVREACAARANSDREVEEAVAKALERTFALLNKEQRKRLAYLLRSRGGAREAEALCREALALRGRVLPDAHPMVAAVLQVLGLSLVEQGRAAEAEPVLRESLELRRRALPAGHWLIASSEGILGDCLAKRGRFVEAEAWLLRSLDELAGSMGEDHERAVEGRRRLVALYEAWGKTSKADRFRAAATAAAP